MSYNLETELKLAEKAIHSYDRYRDSLETFRLDLLCEMEGTAGDYIYSKELNIIVHPETYGFDKVRKTIVELSEKYPSVMFEY